MNRDGSIRVYTADVTPEAARWVAVRQVLTEGDTEAMCTAWSPDGRQIAYGKLRRDLDFAEIRVISLSDGSDRMIWRLPASRDVARLTWSPDGRQLYCSMDPYGRANLVTLTRRVPVGIPSFDEYSYQLNDLFGRFDFRIPADVVEAWERRVGGFYVPNRADGGYAVYRHVFDVPVPERFAVVDCLPTAGDEVAKPLVMPGVDAPVQVAVSRDGTKMAIVNEELSDDGAILTPRVLVCDADGSNQRPLEIRPVGIERPFTVVPVEPDFPITHGCLLKAIQRYAVQVFPEEGWPTVESVRFIFRQVGGRERQVVAEYDVTKPVVALLDPAGEAKATVSPGSPEVARTDGAALAGELCWVETRGESGQVQVGLGIEGDGDVGEWEFTVQVRGHGQESESPILGWVKLYPTTSRAQAASERLMRRQER